MPQRKKPFTAVRPSVGRAGSGMDMAKIEASMRDGGDFEMPPELDAKLRAKIDRAEREEVRVDFRWKPESLEVVKRAAAKVGVPYQTYMKVVLYQQARADLVGKE